MSETESGQTFVSHLIELRTRLLRSVAAVLFIVLCLLPFSQQIYAVMASPLLEQLPEGSSMIAIKVTSPFLTPFKMTAFLGLVLAMPFVLYQLWAFVAPGLYGHEKRIATPILFSSIFLFYLGCAFAYFVVFPLVFAFFTSIAPQGVAVMPDIGEYLDFLLVIFFAFGIAFEVPIAVVILVSLGVFTPQQLASKRPYIIVAAFVIGMLLTPPDMISQTLLAIPVWFLFEVGLFFSRMIKNQSKLGSVDTTQ